jgi:hypothetical protein
MMRWRRGTFLAVGYIGREGNGTKLQLRSYNCDMPIRLKHAAIILGMATVLVFAQRNLARLMVAPFMQDPCDAVWAFAFATTMLIVVVSAVRAFRPLYLVCICPICTLHGS